MKRFKAKLDSFLKLNRSSIDPNPQTAGMDDEAIPSWEREEPCLQPYYSFENDVWSLISPSAAPSKRPEPLPSQVRLISWNIDAMVSFGPARMGRALEYLEELLDSVNSTAAPLIIFLQEMTGSDLKVIQEAPWVREHFYITDRSHLYWEGDYYGTTTLIDKFAYVERVFRVHYERTRMDRDGLFVDIAIEPEVSKTGEQHHPPTTDTAGSPGNSDQKPKILRLCNTHLESLVSIPPIRPTQMKTASKFLHPPIEGDISATLPAPHASILAGDLNAFASEDLTIVPSNNLKDTYLTLGGQEDTEESYTWGMHPRNSSRPSKHPHGRLDKVLYCGGAKPEKLEKIGAGLKVDVAKSWAAQRRANGQVGSDSDDEPFEQWEWVTDHLGLMADFTLVEGSAAETGDD